MSNPACLIPLSFERFVDYWFGDLASGEQGELEEHLFSCALCGKNAEIWAIDLQALGDGARQLPRSFVTPEQLALLGDKAKVIDVSSSGTTVNLRSHSVQVFRVSLDEKLLSELERLDVEYFKEGYPEPIFYVSSVPLPKDTHQLHFACHNEILYAHGDATMRVIGTRQGQRFTLLESLVRMQ